MEGSTRVPTAVVVGGSLSGLMTGTVLIHLGFRVHVLEQSLTLQDAGAGVVLGGDVLEFLRVFDQDHTRVTVQSEARVYVDRRDNVMSEERKPQWMSSWEALYRVLRRNFQHPNDGEKSPDERMAVYQQGCTVHDFVYDEDKEEITVSYTDRSVGEDVEKHEMTADLLVVAEGASSSFRAKLAPQSRRVYAGYVAFRGLAAESDLLEASKSLLGHFTFFHCGKNDGTGNTQFLSYLIPGPKINLEPGQRYLNWVWYQNFRDRGVSKEAGRNTQESLDLQDLLTDKDGNEHAWSIPPNEISDRAMRSLQARIGDLPLSMQSVVRVTKRPFIQAITDVKPPMSKLVHCKAHVLFVGDAVLGPRPHTAASTNQCAVHALSLLHTLAGTPELEALKNPPTTREEAFAGLERLLQARWERNGAAYARMLYASGKEMGDRSQFGTHPMSVDKKAFGESESGNSSDSAEGVNGIIA